MPAEQRLEEAAAEIRATIKIELAKRNMTQAELAELLGENRVAVNRAIGGFNDPKSKTMRKRIYKVLNIN